MKSECACTGRLEVAHGVPPLLYMLKLPALLPKGDNTLKRQHHWGHHDDCFHCRLDEVVPVWQPAATMPRLLESLSFRKYGERYGEV